MLEHLKTVQFQVGVAAFTTIFERLPGTIDSFPFLKGYRKDDPAFYGLISGHAKKVLGGVSFLITTVVCNLSIDQL